MSALKGPVRQNWVGFDTKTSMGAYNWSANRLDDRILQELQAE